MEEVLTCPRCGKSEPEVEFGTVLARASGHNLYCKECINKRRKQSYYEQKDRSEALNQARARIKAEGEGIIQERILPPEHPKIRQVKDLLPDGLTREEISDRAHINLGDVCDVLAILLNRGEARPVDGRWYPK